jgi:hypothetical protein
MTKRTGAIHWERLFAAGFLTVCGVGGCDRGPTAPSLPALGNPAPTFPPDLRNPAPTILSVTPSIGSSGGGASILITGAGLLPGVRVAFGTAHVAVFSGSNPGQISVTSPSHAPGSVDIVVTNVDGQNAVATGAHTFAAPDSFEVNGSWQGVSFVGDYDEPFTFTVENGSVVSITCATSGLMRLSPPAPIIHGEFLFIGEDGVAVSGRIVAPNEAKGDVTVDSVYEVRRPCVEAEWHATKE